MKEICFSPSSYLPSYLVWPGTGAHDPAADIGTEGSLGRPSPESDGHSKLGLDFVNLDWSFYKEVTNTLAFFFLMSDELSVNHIQEENWLASK